jgi:hypothetical protein
MRLVPGVLLILLVLLPGCASEKLALAPPAGVDLSGHWTLNDADSDDPQRVAISQNVAGTAGASGSSGTGGTGGQGGRGGRGGSRAGAAGGYGGGPTGPAMPGVGALSDGLRWPGRELEVTQVAGVVTIASMGTRQVYSPSAADRSTHAKPASGDAGGRGRDPRDGPPPACGWDGRILVVQAENPDDEHPPFEERYGLSDDGTRLIEVVAFKGGRSGGFTVSRVWDRVAPGAAGAAPAKSPGQ